MDKIEYIYLFFRWWDWWLGAHYTVRPIPSVVGFLSIFWYSFCVRHHLFLWRSDASSLSGLRSPPPEESGTSCSPTFKTIGADQPPTFKTIGADQPPTSKTPRADQPPPLIQGSWTSAPVCSRRACAAAFRRLISTTRRLGRSLPGGKHELTAWCFCEEVVLGMGESRADCLAGRVSPCSQVPGVEPRGQVPR